MKTLSDVQHELKFIDSLISTSGKSPSGVSEVCFRLRAVLKFMSAVERKMKELEAL